MRMRCLSPEYRGEGSRTVMGSRRLLDYSSGIAKLGIDTPSARAPV